MSEPRKLQNDIKYAFSLDEYQKEAKRDILSNEIIIINGEAGSGKTSVVAQACLDLLFKKQVSKIWITRPAIEVGKSLGFLPGELDEKLDPYLQPIKDAMLKVYPYADKLAKHISKHQIEGVAVQFIRGKTIEKGEILIIDESQNLTKQEMLALLTRLGKGGKIIVVGDTHQKDIRDIYGGLEYALDLAGKIDDIKIHKLKGNHRSELVAKILEIEYGKK